MPPIIEVCVDSVESAVAAQKGGAARVELCADLAAGGTTPAAGMIEVVRKNLDIGLHVMIRPRSGDFAYSDVEFAVMKADIAAAKKRGADGVVLGILRPDRQLDVERTQVLTGLARPLSVTFHRAIDIVPDPLRALSDLVDIGVDRILTSGQAPTAIEGIPLLKRAIEAAEGKVVIMPGAGISQANIRRLLEETGAREVHVGSGVGSPLEYPAAGMFNAKRSLVVSARVRELLAAASRADGGSPSAPTPRGPGG
jgi:copper homeostasis protein